MKDFVSRRYSGWTLFAALSVLFVACSMLYPYGFPWFGLAWVGLAFGVARWQRISPGRSIYGVLNDVDAEPVPVTVKPGRSSSRVVLQVSWLCFLAVSLTAATPDPAANLYACKNGMPSCDRTQLTLSEMTAVANAERARNVSNCRSGQSSCEKWKLTEAETIALTVAAYDRNVSNCTGGYSPCDAARLTPSEARETAKAERERLAVRLPDRHRNVRPVRAHRVGGGRRRARSAPPRASPTARTASAIATTPSSPRRKRGKWC